MMNCLAIGLALSMHIGLQGDYNQAHPYATCETEKTITGVYYNSLDNFSLVGAYKYKLSDNIILDVGAVTGYVYDIVPMARLRYKNFFVMPAFEIDNRTGLVFGVQFNLLGGKDE
tara:strand:+ start:588 stop:932 length:345 start_codon:yes stop_codon:yes gene_type:complete